MRAENCSPGWPMSRASMLLARPGPSAIPISPLIQNPLPPPLQEEVTSLQTKVQEANTRLEAVKTQLSTEHLRSTSKLQQRNDSLQEDLRATEQLNMRLSDRQHQLVSLQTAVMELWGRCQVRPAPGISSGLPCLS